MQRHIREAHQFLRTHSWGLTLGKEEAGACCWSKWGVRPLVLFACSELSRGQSRSRGTVVLRAGAGTGFPGQSIGHNPFFAEVPKAQVGRAMSRQGTHALLAGLCARAVSLTGTPVLSVVMRSCHCVQLLNSHAGACCCEASVHAVLLWHDIQ